MGWVCGVPLDSFLPFFWSVVCWFSWGFLYVCLFDCCFFLISWDFPVLQTSGGFFIFGLMPKGLWGFLFDWSHLKSLFWTNE